MSVFGSIFGKNRLGKGSQGVAMFSPAAPRARNFSARPVAVSPKVARPKTEHNIGGSKGRGWAPRRWAFPFQSFFRHCKPKRLFPQISGQSKGTTTGYHSDRLGTFSPAAPKFFGRAARRVSPQSGRTLLEMLAVLAIVGILSVAALGGLIWAMAKYRANDTMHDVAVWTFAALDSNQLFDMTSGQLILHELGSVSTHGYPMAVWIQDKDVFTVHVNDVPKRVCSLMLDMIDENQTLTVNDVRFNDDDICTNDTNTLVFYMNKDMGNVGSICIPSCEEGETCCGGECQVIMTPCGSDGCTDCGGDYCTTSNTCCPTPTATKCGDTDCCDTKCCNGVCCPESYMTCDATTTCGCPNNMVPDADTGACKCPDDAPYFFEEAGICCKSGYTPVDGECQRINCEPKSGNAAPYTCYINGIQCGYQCDAEGNCNIGLCQADMCPEQAGTLTRISNNRNFWGNRYGCQHPTKSDCYFVGKYAGTTTWACWNDTNTMNCCDANADGQCTFGVCDETFCSAYSTDQYTASYSRLNLTARPQASCVFTATDETNDQIQCYPRFNDNGGLTSWMCIDVDTRSYCSSECTDAPSCGGQCSEYRCSNGTLDENGYCCKELSSGETMCSRTTSYYIKREDGTYEKCSTGGCNWTTGVCTLGGCSTSGITCPDSYHVAFVDGQGYGCVGDTADTDGSRLSCIKAGSDGWDCYYGGKSCGSGCSSVGKDCSTVLMEQCGAEDPETGKKACPYNTTVTSTCYCDTAPSLAEGELCCAPNHVNVNGACAIL